MSISTSARLGMVSSPSRRQSSYPVRPLDVGGVPSASPPSPSADRAQVVDLVEDPLLQPLVAHVLGQGVETVRVLDEVAADDLAGVVLAPRDPVVLDQWR